MNFYYNWMMNPIEGSNLFQLFTGRGNNEGSVLHCNALKQHGLQCNLGNRDVNIMKVRR